MKTIICRKAMQCDDILQILFQRGLDVPPKLVNASIVEINFKLKLPGLPPLTGCVIQGLFQDLFKQIQGPSTY